MSNIATLAIFFTMIVILPPCLWASAPVDDASEVFRTKLTEAMAQDGFSQEDIHIRALHTPKDLRHRLLGEKIDPPYTPIDFYDPDFKPLPSNPLQKNPPILIVFPGIASDLLGINMFQNITEGSESKVPLNLSKEDEGRVALTNFYSETGQLISRIIDLRYPIYSLESFLPPKKQALTFRRMIDLVFQQAGLHDSEEDVYILGYSRGVLPALTLLDQVQSESQKPSWYRRPSGEQRLKGFISLAGTITGSFADALYKKDPLLINTGNTLAEMLDQMEPDIKAFERNYQLLFGSKENPDHALLIKVLDLLWELQTVMPLKAEPVNRQKGLFSIPEFTDPRLLKESGGRRLIELLQSNMATFFGIVTKLTGHLIIIDGNIRHQHAPDEISRAQIARTYAEAIMSLKRVKHIIPGLMIMQKDRLKKFWGTLALPHEITYYSLSTTLPEPIKGFQEANAPGYRRAYDTFHRRIDSLVLRVPYYTFVDQLGDKLNDGQVSVSQSLIRPALLSLGTGLTYQVTDLGVVGSSHWEIVFDQVFKNPDDWVKPPLGGPSFHTSVVKALVATLQSMDRGR